MRAAFAAEYKCPDYVHEVYQDLERRLYPMIKRRALHLRRMVPTIDLEDAIQEGRLALLSCLEHYDCNKSNFSLERYVWRVLRNTYAMMASEAHAQCRMPRVAVRQLNGDWETESKSPLSFNEFIQCDERDEREVPEIAVLANERVAVVQRLVKRIEDRLDYRDLEVFELMIDPPESFLCMIAEQDGPEAPMSNLHMASWVGCSKNQVDWSIVQIRLAFADLAKEKDEDAALIADHAKSNGWPVVHVSHERGKDKDFVEQVMTSRCLDDAKMKESSMHVLGEGDDDAYWMRRIDWYTWGMVMVVKRGKDWATLVVEGKVNLRNGNVFGLDNPTARERIPVSWYYLLGKKLYDAGMHE
jgi:hypothetical protein